MFKLNTIDYSKLYFVEDMNTFIYNDHLNPLFDAPLASITQEDGFKYVDENIVLTFNSDQYIYDVMRHLLTHISQKTNETIYYPISIEGGICTITMKTVDTRIPVFVTTTQNGSSKCYLNVGNKLNEFLTTELGFRYIF